MSEQVSVLMSVVKRLKEFPATVAQLAEFIGQPAVFTTPPQDFNGDPYIVISDSNLSTDDNDNGFRFEGVFNVHTWSNKRDMIIVGNLQKAIYDALHHYELPMNGYEIIDLHQEFSDILLDPDGITSHGVQRFRISLKYN